MQRQTTLCWMLKDPKELHASDTKAATKQSVLIKEQRKLEHNPKELQHTVICVKESHIFVYPVLISGMISK